MLTITWWILLLPLAAALLNFSLLLSRPKTVAYLATATMFACFILTLYLLPDFLKLHHEHALPLESSIRWIQLSHLSIELGILLDGLTIWMLLVVTGIGSLIFLFSMSYMEHDEGYARYFIYLSLFAFSMLGIVISNNLIQTFIFWELVGLSSYLLIGFWFEKDSASTAGKKAFLTTRVGDVGMMIGILALYGFLSTQGHGTFNFMQIEHHLGSIVIPAGWMTAISLCLFMGVAGKSAQVPLHVWLPDAMEGPTPVSALIHAATMVAAGVFLLARLFFIFSLSSTALLAIAWIGVVTSVLAATIAIVQNDIKKILAYSTLSQLGYMVMAIGLKSTDAGMFHLITHAFFKALLFLGSASLIHAFHTQNIWEMAGTLTRQGQRENFALLKKMPVTGITFLIGTFALMGLPPLSGFYSKEEILSAASEGPKIIFILSMAVVFLTAFYMGRLLSAILFSQVDGTAKGHDEHPLHESDWRMGIPLSILAVFAAISGFLPIRDLFPGHHAVMHEHHSSVLMWSSISLALSGAILGILLFRNKPRGLSTEMPAFNGPKNILENKYGFDAFYDWMIKNIQENIAFLSDQFEKWVIIEGGANGTAKGAKKLGDLLRKLQTGTVQFYILSFSAGLTVILYLCLIKGQL